MALSSPSLLFPSLVPVTEAARRHAALQLDWSPKSDKPPGHGVLRVVGRVKADELLAFLRSIEHTAQLPATNFPSASMPSIVSPTPSPSRSPSPPQERVSTAEGLSSLPRGETTPAPRASCSSHLDSSVPRLSSSITFCFDSAYNSSFNSWLQYLSSRTLSLSNWVQDRSFWVGTLTGTLDEHFKQAGFSIVKVIFTNFDPATPRHLECQDCTFEASFSLYSL